MTKNKNLPRTAISEYLSGAKDMEIQIYVMNKTKESLENKKASLINEMNMHTKKADSGHKFCKNKDGSIIGEIVAHLILLLIYINIWMIPGAILGFFIMAIFLDIVEIPIRLPMVIIAIIGGIMSWLRDNFNLPRKKKCETKHCRIFKKRSNENNVAISVIDSQINELNNAIKIVKMNLSIYYQFNVIPLNYRYDVCVIFMDYAFQNHNANTILEAILLYDQNIKFKNLQQALQDTGIRNCGMTDVLNYINSIISEINYDIQRITSGHSTPSKESRITRYAIEAIKSSNKILERHFT